MKQRWKWAIAGPLSLFLAACTGTVTVGAPGEIVGHGEIQATEYGWIATWQGTATATALVIRLQGTTEVLHRLTLSSGSVTIPRDLLDPGTYEVWFEAGTRKSSVEILVVPPAPEESPSPEPSANPEPQPSPSPDATPPVVASGPGAIGSYLILTGSGIGASGTVTFGGQPLSIGAWAPGQISVFLSASIVKPGSQILIVESNGLSHAVRVEITGEATVPDGGGGGGGPATSPTPAPTPLPSIANRVSVQRGTHVAGPEGHVTSQGLQGTVGVTRGAHTAPSESLYASQPLKGAVGAQRGAHAAGPEAAILGSTGVGAQVDAQRGSYAQQEGRWDVTRGVAGGVSAQRGAHSSGAEATIRPIPRIEGGLDTQRGTHAPAEATLSPARMADAAIDVRRGSHVGTGGAVRPITTLPGSIDTRRGAHLTPEATIAAGSSAAGAVTTARGSHAASEGRVHVPIDLDGAVVTVTPGRQTVHQGTLQPARNLNGAVNGSRGTFSPVEGTWHGALAPSTVALTSPSAPSHASGILGITAAASDAFGIKRVELLLDGVAVAEFHFVGGSAYRINLDTRPYADGQVVLLQARAVNTRDQELLSAAVPITIRHGPIAAPDLSGRIHGGGP